MQRFLGAGFLLIALIMNKMADAQTVLPLYPRVIPGSKPTPDRESESQWNGIRILQGISRPQLLVFLPEKRKLVVPAVIICPGGGYGVNAIQHEGIDVARLLNSWGVAAFVLKYRLPDDAAMEDRSTGPLQDVQQAFRLVRQRAAEFGVDVNRVGVMGFSAGGHLASTAATHFDRPVVGSAEGLRPDFQILIYPVISMEEGIGHMGSRENLLGKSPAPDQVRRFSNEQQVTKSTPPAFLIHASDDEAVPAENSLSYVRALLKAGVGAELHLAEKGGHGFGLKNPLAEEYWPDRLQGWMQAHGWADGAGK